MKILKIFGVVVVIHVFALILIFANPGCSSNTKPAPAPADTVSASAEPSSPKITVPSTAAAATETSPVSAAPMAGNETSPIVAAPADLATPSSASVAIRFTPTRPGTAAAGALEAEPVAGVTPATTYTVCRGDSLWTIAKKNRLTVSELAAANNVKSGATVHIGQKLLIPSKPVPGLREPAAPAKEPAPAAASASSAPKAAGDTVRHVVKPNETLGAIARKYGVKIGDIATANNITDPKRIRPGMELVIPGWQAPVGKAGTKSAATPAKANPVAIPTIAVPRPDQDLDAGLKPTAAPPVIQIEDASAPKKP